MERPFNLNIIHSNEAAVGTMDQQKSPTSLLGLRLSDGQNEPRVLRINGVRIVSPYVIVADLNLGKRMAKRQGTCTTATRHTIRGALEALSRQGKRMMPTARWWINEIEASRVYLDAGMAEKAVSANDIVTPSTCLYAKYHYHEQAVIDARANVLYSDDQYVVVNKPPGIDVLANPAHFRVHNSLPRLLLEEMERGETCASTGTSNSTLRTNSSLPKPAHRLDSPVSGLVCCGRTNSDVKRLSRRIELGETEKVYVARVRLPSSGKLPNLPHVIDEALGFDGAKSMAFVASRGTPGTKEATTIVQECLRQMRDGTAIVSIRILTGRKHQIRCHLQHAGIPIANDYRYCDGNIEASAGEAGAYTSSQQNMSAFGMPHPPDQVRELYALGNDKYCEHCSFVRDLFAGKRGFGPNVMEGIWLHCWKYGFPTLGLKFESPLPNWAVE